MRDTERDPTGLLDTERDPVFDALTRLAATVLGAAGALLTLVTPERQWFKSSHGLREPWHSRRETPLTHSFCKYVVTHARPLVVDDARRDPVLRDSLAITELGVIGYLGVPLVHAGRAVGSFAVFEADARAWTPHDEALLREFASLAMVQVRHRAETTRREHIAAQHAALLAHIPAAVLGVATDGRLLYANDRARALWQRYLVRERDGEYVRAGAGPEALRSADGRPLGRDELPLRRAIVHGEATTRRDYHLTAPDGATRVVRASAVPVVTASGTASGALLIAEDVTDDVGALRQLREEQERARSLNASSPVGIFQSDREGRVTWANPRLLQIWHASEREVLGHGWRRRVHPGDVAELTDTWVAALAAGVEYEREFRLQLDDGAVRWVHGRSAPLHDASGAVVGSVGTIEDVTEQREIRERYAQAQKMDAIGRLAGGIAHDFNNLLTVIRAGAEFVLEQLPPDAAARGDAEEIRDAADRAARLTRQLLAYGRRQLLRPTVVDPNDAVRGVESLLRRAIGEDVRLVTDLAADAGAILVDVGQLEQVLVNLAVNARDAMPNGGTLTIRTRRRGGAVVVTMGDTGVGMDAATRERALEPFFTTKPPERGTGLGLAVVQGIVTQSGGAVELESAPGEGTRVHLTFPAVAEAPTPAAAGAARVSAGTGTVLLVEDEAAVRGTLCRLLRSYGYAVVEACDARDALARWAERVAAAAAPFDALVTDVVMPDVDGGELARRLRDEAPRLPVLFLSGYAERALPEALLSGAARVLAKPVSGEALAAALAELLAPPPPARRDPA